MFSVTLSDGSKRQFDDNIKIIDVAKSISKSLAKKAIIAKLDGNLVDLSELIVKDCVLQIITLEDDEALEIIRHDTAHLMAYAVQSLWPDVQITIGPTIQDGFYYDFASKQPFSESDLEKIENKMHELAKLNEPFIRKEYSRDDAIKYFQSIGEEYKVEIIKSIDTKEKISLYAIGDNFIDLCRGPHGLSTGILKHFKLMKIAGAYWRGSSDNEMLQRIYGTAWASAKQLQDYLNRLEEAKARDHRKLGKELELFHIQAESPGMAFWHENGTIIYNIIQEYIRNKLFKSGYFEVKTPVLVDSELWKKSGHFDKFGDDMFYVENDDKTYALKPMNCPCHVQIFNQSQKSYRDLPLRMAEFGSCYRNEASGALHGLMRVRNFVQDDAHIFCTEDQINSETVNFCNSLIEIYKDFGFVDIKVKFSDRPEIRAGDDAIWDKAENALRSAVEDSRLKYSMNKGEGAFYGPKLEFVLTDEIGRDWQCGTIQTDFILPKRLGAEYVDKDGSKKTPVMLHRAIIGSFERFIGMLIEQYAGKFPIWLAPVQVAIVTVNNECVEYAKKIQQFFSYRNIRSKLDIGSDKISYKIRHFSHLKVPIIAIIGSKEVENNNITLRFLGDKNQMTVSSDELYEMILKENNKYL